MDSDCILLTHPPHSVASGKPIKFTCTRAADDPDGAVADGGKSSFLVGFDIDVTNLGDFVRITV